MSLAHRIIPCLDTDGERVVKGVNFVALRDAGDPVALARRYNAEGADELVVLDIAASRDRRPTFLETIRKVAAELAIPLTAGGGIRDAGRRARRGSRRSGQSNGEHCRGLAARIDFRIVGGIWLASGGFGDRCKTGWRLLACDDHWRAGVHGFGGRLLGYERSRAWRRRNSADLGGSRRNTKWFRRGSHRGDIKTSYGAGDCFRRGQMAATFCRDFLRRSGRRGVGSLNFS